MKNLSKVFLVIGFIALFAGEKESLAKDTGFTITFNPDISEKYIRVINLMTGTKIINKKQANIYSFSSLNINNSVPVSHYADLFSMIPEVISIQSATGLYSFDNKPKAGQIVPGVILVRFKKGITIKDINDLMAKNKTKSELISTQLLLYKIILPVTLNVQEAVKLFSNQKIVEYAEPDRVMTIQPTKSNFITMNKAKVQSELDITFRPGTEELATGLFNLIYNTNLTIVKNSKNYIFKLPADMHPETATQALKLCPYITNIKISQRNN